MWQPESLNLNREKSVTVEEARDFWPLWLWKIQPKNKKKQVNAAHLIVVGGEEGLLCLPDGKFREHVKRVLVAEKKSSSI